MPLQILPVFSLIATNIENPNQLMIPDLKANNKYDFL